MHSGVGWPSFEGRPLLRFASHQREEARSSRDLKAMRVALGSESGVVVTGPNGGAREKKRVDQCDGEAWDRWSL